LTARAVNPSGRKAGVRGARILFLCDAHFALGVDR